MSIEAGHYYTPDGKPAHFVEKKDGSGKRPTNISDCRKNGWLPSCTTILKILDKPALREWIIRQAVHAVTTAPDVAGESLDAKIERILSVEKQQDEESQIARDRGTDLHAAMEAYFTGQEVREDLRPWIAPAALSVAAMGVNPICESILVGDGYAGMCDLILEGPANHWILDFKSTKKLPTKGAYPEAVLQCSAYAAAYHRMKLPSKPIRTANVYISTVDQGKFVICEHDSDWQKCYNSGFHPLLQHWQWSNSYTPAQ